LLALLVKIVKTTAVGGRGEKKEDEAEGAVEEDTKGVLCRGSHEGLWMRRDSREAMGEDPRGALEEGGRTR